MKINIMLLILFASLNMFAQQEQDTIPGEAEYRKHFDCRYEPGNILLVQKKGKTVELDPMYGVSDSGFVIRMEAVYDLEFKDGKRFKTAVVKDITQDALTFAPTLNENSARYEGIPYELKTYSIIDLKIVRFVTDRSLGFYAKKKIEGKYDLIVQNVDKAKLCPAVLTFTSRNNEVKICPYYLMSSGWDLLFETDGFIDYMFYDIKWE